MTDKAAIILIVALYFAIVSAFMFDWIVDLFEGD